MKNTPPLPLWMAGADAPRYPQLRGDLIVDVVVIGAGITGITTALLCKRAGLQVALIDAHRVAGGETGHTTSHLTELLDHRYFKVVQHFGREKAQLVAESMRSAIERIALFVEQERLDCGFERVPAFLYTERSRDVSELMKELDATRSVGINSSFMDVVPLPFMTRGALRLENQAQLDPRRYLLPLAAKIPGEGSHVFEHTRALKVDRGAVTKVETDFGAITAGHVVLATNSVMNGIFLHTRVAAYRTYALAARAKNLPPPGLYWDTDDPYHYTRTQKMPDGQWLIVGGEDHKTGRDVDTEESFQRLEEYVRSRYQVESVDHRWSGQVLEPVDGLAYIGRHTSMDNGYVATGFSGTGMTWGTVAGMLLSDLILGIKNPWAHVYDPRRVKPLASAVEFVKENVDFPFHLVTDRVTPAEVRSVAELEPGEGAIVSAGGKKLAVYRDEQGVAHALSPVCTHMGCHVNWNKAEKSWDCPCHGGRYDSAGRVLNGPPTRDLKAMPLADEDDTDKETNDERPGPSEEAAP